MFKPQQAPVTEKSLSSYQIMRFQGNFKNLLPVVLYKYKPTNALSWLLLQEE